MQVKFDTLEYVYLAGVFNKMMKARKNFTEKEMSKGINALVKELANKFSPHVEASPSHEVPLKRTHVRYLQEMLGKTIVLIDEKIIPEYKSRGNVEELGEYITRMNTNRAMIESMLKRLEGSL